jgi:hypothetical protein
VATDKEIIDWLEEHGQGWALVSDDFGRWAIATDGFQNVPENPDVPSDISTSFFIEASQWQPSIREAFAMHFAARKSES